MISAKGELEPEGPRAHRVGADLRLARERLGWSLADTSAFLRIRLPFLAALEDGRIGDLPGPAYAIGFVRSYAVALGLDRDELARRYHDEVGAFQARTRLNFPTPLPQRGVPAGAVVVLGAVLAIGAYVGWYRVSGEQPTTVVVQQVPARLAPLVLAPLAPVTPAKIASVAPAVSAPYVMPSVPPSAAEAAAPAPGSLNPVVPAVVAAVPGAAASRVLLGATADAWVQVKDGQGRVVMARLMHAGESWAVPNEGKLSLTTGNAGGTTLSVDGVTVAPLGGPGVVKRDVSLDPTTLALVSPP